MQGGYAFQTSLQMHFKLLHIIFSAMFKYLHYLNTPRTVDSLTSILLLENVQYLTLEIVRAWCDKRGSIFTPCLPMHQTERCKNIRFARIITSWQPQPQCPCQRPDWNVCHTSSERLKGFRLRASIEPFGTMMQACSWGLRLAHAWC